MDVNKTLLKHKEFIQGVALLNLKPQKDNINLLEVFDAYKQIDETPEVLAECSTCETPYKNSFKIILAYCESNNWFENDATNKNKRTKNTTI